ncbi:MAG: bifunctional proline dehydrogenase/L-glutamate gamma-semialdehyde dehydrogenase PutA, partial [Steroidobacteraceae bacterium]
LRVMANGFIAGEALPAALARSARSSELALCSYDMLGEGARTQADADRFAASYAAAIDALRLQPGPSVHERSGISVKLSAIEPRYSLLQKAGVVQRALPKLLALARAAASADIGLTLDAEEADRLDLSLDLLAAVAADPVTRDWEGLGLAVQAYGPRAAPVIEWVIALARGQRRRMTVRLVKGAYWDTEIKRAQERGLDGFPVFTSKAATDLSYLCCARRLLAATDVIYPQFATHNAVTLASILALATGHRRFEFQRLHGMGDLLYRVARESQTDFPPVRVYAPVGAHESLLPYLVRRLLENGANSSFVHQFLDPELSVAAVTRDPSAVLHDTVARSSIRLPRDLFGHRRINSRGVDFGDPRELASIEAALRTDSPLQGGPIIAGRALLAATRIVHSPSDSTRVVGHCRDAEPDEIRAAFDAAAEARVSWDATPAGNRAAVIECAATLIERRRDAFLVLLVREAGKTIPDAIAEIREAVDFCRYYAAQARQQFGSARAMPGPDGETNELTLHGRGVFACISPWNFPLAIFTGQVVAALLAGNAVVAKPSQHTTLIAHAMVDLLHEAGIPAEVLALTPSSGAMFGRLAFEHPALAGVVVTGSTTTATAIHRALAARDGPIVTLIAETGGLNAMIADATALPEQLVDDAVASAFTSAGQRCSALRVLYVQSEIADRVIGMLIGAMRLLRIGDPADASTDVGPVISAAARERLELHANNLQARGQRLFACELLPDTALGQFVAPQLFELRSFDELRTEEFGPLLHVIRYGTEDLAEVIAAIRGTGYGLTFGVHSRIEAFADFVASQVGAGNTYVNRNIIGAVVGSQPFGGSGLSGTGPKAGGPHYLARFAAERTMTVNTAALGGNVDLLGSGDV